MLLLSQEVLMASLRISFFLSTEPPTRFDLPLSSSLNSYGVGRDFPPLWQVLLLLFRLLVFLHIERQADTILVGRGFVLPWRKTGKKKTFWQGTRCWVDGVSGPSATDPQPSRSIHFASSSSSVCLSLVPRQRRDKNLPHPHRMLLFHIILYYSAHTSCRPTKCAVNERPPLHQFTTVFKVKREYLISRRQLENL